MTSTYYVVYDNHIQLTSILNLKIFLFLSHNKGMCNFKELQNYLNRSKSQVSVALKKLEAKKLITRNTNRPQIISLTSKGKDIKNKTMKDILKFKNSNHVKQEINQLAKNNLVKISKNTIGKLQGKKNQTKSDVKHKEVFKDFVKDVRKIIENELIEYIGARIPLEILSTVSFEIKNKIHDKLFEYF